MLISPEVILEQNTASGNYKYLMEIYHFRLYVKTALSFFGCRCSTNFDEIEIVIKQVFGCFMTSGRFHIDI